MKNRTRAAVLAATATAVLVATTTVADAAVPAHPHPPITDVAGDATTALGVRVAGADIRSADLKINGGKLVVTLKTAASAPAGSGPISNFDHAPYMISGVFSDPNGQAVPFRVTLNPGGGPSSGSVKRHTTRARPPPPTASPGRCSCWPRSTRSPTSRRA